MSVKAREETINSTTFARNLGEYMDAEAYLFHEMLHTQADENGKPITVPHDWFGFDAELREYGLYDEIMQAAGAAFQQLRLDA